MAMVAAASNFVTFTVQFFLPMKYAYNICKIQRQKGTLTLF